MSNSIGKTALAEKVAAKTESTVSSAAKTIEVTFEEITDSIAGGVPVTIPGFGTFNKVHRKARTGHNPQSGEKIEIPERDVPTFKASPALKKRVSEG